MGLYLDEPLLAFAPVLYKSKMPGIVHIGKYFKEGTFGLRSDEIEAGLEGREEFVDVFGSDGDADMKADAMECVRVLNVG